MTDLDDEYTPTVVEPTPMDVTRNHDTGEWLAGFNQGVTAGRRDLMQALRGVLGESPVAKDVELRLLEYIAERGGL